MKDESWDSVSFAELVEFHDRHRIPLSKKERVDRSGPFPYYGAQGIIDWVDDYIFDGRYLLIAEDGENLRSRKQPVAYMADGQFWVNNHAHVVKAVKGVADDDFLRAYVEFHPLSGLITGAAQPKLSQASLKRLPVAAPPYAVQTRIGEAVRVVDGLLQNNWRRIEILEEMARLLYREWFVHFRYPGHEDVELVDSDLGPLPKGWEVWRVGDALETTGGGTPSKSVEEYWLNGDVQWFTPTDLTRAASAFVFDSGSKITELGLKKSSARRFPAGSVMMTSRATIGVISISATEAATNQGFITCAPSERLPSSYIYFWLHANLDLFLSLAGGATFRELRKSTFRELRILVPDQQEMYRFEEHVGPMLALTKNLLRQNQALVEARDLLLPRLVSGDLDVSELDLGLVAV